MKKVAYIILLIFLGILIYHYGFRIPPETISISELPVINTLVYFEGAKAEKDTFELTSEDIRFWKSLNMSIERKSPGNTNDYIIELKGGDIEYTAIYDKNSSIIWFSFVDIYSYGFINSPPPGGWILPLYSTDTTNQLFEFLRIRKH